MKNWFSNIRAWVAGKKTYIFGGLLILVAVAGVAIGRMGVVTACAVGGYGLSMCGFAAKSNRQHKELVLVLEGVAAAGIAARAGGIPALIAAAEKELPQLAAEFTGDEQ